MVALFNLIVLTGAVVHHFVDCFRGLPFLFMWSQIMVSENKGIFNGMGRAGKLSKGNYGPMVGLAFTLLLCGILFFSILDSGFLLFGNNVLYMLLDYLSMNFLLEGEQSVVFFNIAVTFIAMLILLLVFGLLVAGSGLQYFSNLEVNEARALREKIKNIKTRQEYQGD